MKKVLFAFCLLYGSAYGQFTDYTGGTLSTTVNGSSVKLQQDTAWRNCGSDYDQQISIHGDTITWLQVDFGFSYGCTCFFNYSVTIDSLPDGDYTAMVWYTLVSNALVFDSTTGTWGYSHVPRDTTYAGTTVFSISGGIISTPVHSSSYASACLLTKINVSEIDVRAPFPNPTLDRLYLPGVREESEVEIMDVLGRRVDGVSVVRSGNGC